MKFHRQIFFLIPVLLLNVLQSTSSYGQQSVDPAEKLKSYLAHTSNEKLYVHLSRPDPVTGELLWFSLFTLDQQAHRPLTLSSFAYAELIDASGNFVLRTRVPLSGGRGQGSMYLPATLNTGTYLFRCYTSWMKNADPQDWFNQSVTIINTVRSSDKIEKNAVQQSRATLFPEGGYLVYGLSSRVALHVVSQDGTGLAAKGAILRKSGIKSDTVVTFRTGKFGMTAFQFKPQANVEYTIVLNDYRGRLIPVTLPQIQPAGWVMTVADTLSGHSKVSVAAVTEDDRVRLVIHTRGKIVYSESSRIKGGKAEFLADRKDWPEGIAHLTVFNSENMPVAERLVFKMPELNTLELKSSQTTYATRSRATLQLQNKLAADAGYSVSVYRADSLQVVNSILESLLLTSDLHGSVESPAYYFSGHPQASSQLDLLMMINGWRRFRWNDVLSGKTKPLMYLPEITGHIIEGQIMDQSGKPVAGKNALLSSPGKNVQLYVAHSDSVGRIRFNVRGDQLSNRVIVQPDLSVDSLLRIEMKSPYSSELPAWNFRAVRLKPGSAAFLKDRSLAMQVQDIFHEEETFYTYKPIAADSTPFYGKPDERYFLDDYTRFPVMEEVMREYVKGVWVRKRKDQFRLMVVDRLKNDVFSDNPLVLLDGVPVFNINKLFELDPTKIRRLDVMTRRYMLGAVRAAGIVSYTSYNGDMAGLSPDVRSVTLDYEALERQREFYAPTYTTLQARESRIPDRRQLLYFNSNLNIAASGRAEVEFYTSDVTGKFIVEVNGITLSGNPQYSSAAFEVSK
jgi:hypothetical protein